MLYKENLWNLVEGTEKQPADSTEKEVAKFQARRNRAFGLIGLAIEDEFKNHIVECENVSELWTKLKEIMQPRSLARLAQLRRKFLELKFEDETMVTFMSKLDRAAKEIRETGGNLEDRDLAFQMLDKLPESFDGLVSQLYQLSDEEFKSDIVRSKLLTEYDRRMMKEDGKFDKASNVFHTVKHSKGRAQHKQGFRPASNRTFNKQNFIDRICFQCKRPGHIAKFCPTSRKSYKNQTDSFFVNLGATEFYNDTEWLIDTGATEHVCANINFFKNYRELKPFHMGIAEGTSTVKGLGTVHLKFKYRNEDRDLYLKNA